MREFVCKPFESVGISLIGLFLAMSTLLVVRVLGDVASGRPAERNYVLRAKQLLDIPFMQSWYCVFGATDH